MNKLLIVACAKFTGATGRYCSWLCPHRKVKFLVEESIEVPWCGQFDSRLSVMPSPTGGRGYLVRLEACVEAQLAYDHLRSSVDELSAKLRKIDIY